MWEFMVERILEGHDAEVAELRREKALRYLAHEGFSPEAVGGWRSADR